MTVARVVCDTGALISLEKLSDGYCFIRRLYNKLLLSPTVFEELTFAHIPPDNYLRQYQIQDLFDIRKPTISLVIPGGDALHRGEIEAICLAWEYKTGLLIEESAGRYAAQQLGIPMSGIAGQILKAYRTQVIAASEATQKLHELLYAGRISQKLYLALTHEMT